jgi:SOS response regulatory protein OraA/RecX
VAPDEDAYRAAAKRAFQLRTLDERTFKARLGQWLARRGFDWDTVGRVVERLWSESEAGAVD